MRHCERKAKQSISYYNSAKGLLVSAKGRFNDEKT